MKNREFDVIVIGSGPGGYVAAIRAGQKGLKTAIIERKAMGGLCLNAGCIPSKSLQKSARLFKEIKQAANFGITGIDKNELKLDWKKMNQRAGKIIQQFGRGIENLLTKNSVEIINGEAEVIARDKIEVNGESLTCRNLILATGSHYRIPDYMAGVACSYSAANIYSIEDIPASIAITGGGVIGVEFAFLFSALGSKVTLIEKGDEIIPFMDDDLILYLKRLLKKSRIKLRLSTSSVGFEEGALVLQSNEKSESLKADCYLFAVTREPELTALETLVKSGLSLDSRGFIRTDNRCRTSLPGVYAVGDVNGKFMLAHVASAEGTCAVDDIVNEGKDIIYDLMPYNLYSDPEIASIGMSEKDALSKGFLTETGKFPFSANGKALAEGKTEGFVKIVTEKKYGEILGIHIIAHNATDLIGEAALAIQLESTVADIAMITHPHPTFVEAILEASFKSDGNPLHTL